MAKILPFPDRPTEATPTDRSRPPAQVIPFPDRPAAEDDTDPDASPSRIYRLWLQSQRRKERGTDQARRDALADQWEPALEMLLAEQAERNGGGAA